MKKRLIAAALVAGATPAFAAEGPVYAYCSAQDRNAKTYISQIYTITVDGLELGGKIPVGSTLVASRRASDLQGQFVSAAEAEGWRSDNAMCFAADTMENLQQHYDRGKSSESRAKYGVDMGKFANWVPTGEFFIRAEHWKN